jgi:DNA modification methylase
VKINCAHKELVELHKLQVNPKNPNKHPSEQIDLLAKIIDYQGQRSPIVVSNRSGFITKGHGRLEAIKKLGWDKAAVDFQDYENEAQEYADMVADNKIAELAKHDDAFMLETISNMDLSDLPSLDLLGMLDFKMPEVFEPQSDEDSVPENVETRAKPGDIWQLGRHRLMCGDSTNVQHIDSLMNSEKADMVFTDPPYGMFLDTDYTKIKPTSLRHSEFQKAKGKITNKNYDRVIGDNEDFTPELIQVCLGYFSYCSEIFLWGADYYSELLTNKNDGSWVVWDKRSNEEAEEVKLDNMFGSSFELCWSKARHKRLLARIKYASLFGAETQDQKKRVHPTQKPIQLAQWFFEKWGEASDKVVDLFGGSGSTLIACEKTGRNCFMMELDPKYCDVILARWEKYAGKTAELISG